MKLTLCCKNEIIVEIIVKPEWKRILCVIARDVNETLAYETETRPRHSVFGPRRDRDI